MSLSDIVDRTVGATPNFGPGRRASAPPTAAVVRELTEQDLHQASNVNTQPIKPKALVQIRQTHHTIARLLAQGMKPVEVSSTVGISQNRISILCDDPAFAELLAQYTSMEKTQHETMRADMHQRLAALGVDTIEVLHEKLLEAPHAFTVKELVIVAELSADRTGFGKTSTVNMNATHSLSHETLARIRAQTETGAAVSEEDRGALLRIARERTGVHQDEAPQAADWIEGTGRCVREESSEIVANDVGAEPGLGSVD